MRYLVTGATGAFGANMAKLLLENGHEVISILHDEGPTNTAKLLDVYDKITWTRGSILEERFCKRVIADYGVDSIIHFAALPLVQVATRTIVPIFQVNLMGTINLLEAVKENAWASKNIRFVYVSTDKVYGDAGNVPYTEDMPLNGLAPYDCSKACADLTTQTYAVSGFIPQTVIARPCNIIAPGDLNFGRILPRIIIPCLRGESPNLYYTKYKREFIAVRDAVEAIYTIDQNLKLNPDKIHGRAFNVGSGNQRSLEQVVETIFKHFPNTKPTWTDPPAISRVEIPFQALNTKRIFEATGWKAKISFEEAIDNLIKWWKSNWEKLPPGIREHQTKGWHG